MKRIIPTLPCALAALMLCGCQHNYVITLNNGSRINCTDKPKFEKGVYIFKDGRGQKVYVPAGRVREIAPASMVAEQDKTRFTPSKQ
jgi:hypothetical protein